MRASFALDGVRDLRAQLNRLPPIAAQRVVKPAFVAGAQFIKRAVKLAAPRGKTGNLKRGLVVSAPRFFDALSPYVDIGWRSGRAGAGHAHLVEKGTGARTNRRGANRGAAKANPFFEEAVALATEAAFTVVRMTWATRLALEARAWRGGGLRLDGRIRR